MPIGGLMTRKEILFAEGLISALSFLGIEQIPFATLRFREGVKKMKKYLFNEKIDSLGNIPKTLFVSDTNNGDFERLTDTLEQFNGNYLSFDNPSLVSARIKMQKPKAMWILESSPLGINRDILINAAKEFCEGSKINF